jgi:AcrR family transcriptional regulator
MLTMLTGGTMDTKELILLVAKEEFIKKGYDDTSLRDIAKKCHISPTAIYRHFENKEDIFNEIIRPLFNYFDEATNYIQSTDYKFLKENKPSNVWDFER